MSGKKRVLVMPGDGIGLEVTTQAARVLETAAESAGLALELDEAPVGGASLEASGEPITADALKRAREADAVLLGAVGGPQWDGMEFAKRPEKGLLRLRQELELFANLRPAQVFADLVSASTLKREVVEGCDLMVVRELTGGIYFGEPRAIEDTYGGRRAYNTMVYTEAEIERIVRMGFEIARKRGKHLTSVDKANVLEVSVLWREVAERLAPEYGDVTLEHMYVDNAAMQLIRAPKQLDTLVTENMFGDILSDAAAMLTGSIGMLPSASLGKQHALYEPVHGSAPDIAGQDMANPLATILSVGMMFRYTFGMPDVDERIQRAVSRVLGKYRTPDIQAPGTTAVGCAEMAERVLAALVQIEQTSG